MYYVCVLCTCIMYVTLRQVLYPDTTRFYRAQVRILTHSRVYSRLRVSMRTCARRLLYAPLEKKLDATRTCRDTNAHIIYICVCVCIYTHRHTYAQCIRFYQMETSHVFVYVHEQTHTRIIHVARYTCANLGLARVSAKEANSRLHP